MSEELTPTITQADIAAAEAQSRKFYQTAYDYEMDLRKAFAAHREAASPEMLAALKYAAQALEYLPIRNTESKLALARVNEAIAKAEGETK